jgi:hypothetical protein
MRTELEMKLLSGLPLTIDDIFIPLPYNKQGQKIIAHQELLLNLPRTLK